MQILTRDVRYVVRGFRKSPGFTDPLTLATAATLLFSVSIASGLLPAWRAAHVNPTEALRAE
jgi:ABC-type lipoprotein release transport system permease subunit